MAGSFRDRYEVRKGVVIPRPLNAPKTKASDRLAAAAERDQKLKAALKCRAAVQRNPAAAAEFSADIRAIAAKLPGRRLSADALAALAGGEPSPAPEPAPEQ